MVSKTTNPTCDKCNIPVSKFRHLHKINGEYICNKCYIKNRKKHREETINSEGIKEELKELDRKRKREWAEDNKEQFKTYQKERYHKLNPNARTYNKSKIKPLTIRGSKEWKRNHRKPSSNSYLTMYEKQLLFRFLVKSGLDYEDADKRIKDLIQKQIEIREQFKLQNKSEEEIKLKQMQLIEELYNYPNIL